jgi:predicted ribosomally synthesized peptide with nif11-like leader
MGSFARCRLSTEEVVMSREAVRGFVQMVDREVRLRAELEKALAQDEGAIAACLATAEAAGFQFTAQEFVDEMRVLQAPEEGAELSDADLARVAGGVGSSSLSRLAVRICSTRIGASSSSIGIGHGPGVSEQEMQEDEEY